MIQNDGQPEDPAETVNVGERRKSAGTTTDDRRAGHRGSPAAWLMLKTWPVELIVIVVVFALSVALAWAGARGMLAMVFVYLLRPPAAGQSRSTASGSADAAVALAADPAA